MHIEALAHFVAEALAEQLGHVRLIINDQDADAHHAPRDLGRAPAARQAYGELGEGPRLALDLDRAAMLLGDDVVADRQAEPRPFAGWLGREKGLEQLGADLGLNARPVVAHPDLDRLAEIARRDPERRSVAAIGSAQMALPGGVKAVAKQVEEDTGDVLRHDLDRA